MFSITVGSVTKSIAVKYCPFCGASMENLQKISFNGESEQKPLLEGFHCNNCSLAFEIGNVDTESFNHMYGAHNQPLIQKEKESIFLETFEDGVWDEKENYY